MTNETTKIIADVGDKFAAGFIGQVNEGRETVNHVLEWLVERGAGFLVSLIVAAITLVIGWLVIRLISKGLTKAMMRGKRKETLFTVFAVSVVNKACWAVLGIMVLGRLGVNVGPLIAGLGVTGFILGFAFQESLGNLASGMMIALNEPFRVGDFVEVAGLSGTVSEVNMMATVLATADNKKLVVPNKSVWGGPITNYSALGKRRVEVKVGIAYGEDIARAVEVAREAAASVPGVLGDPALKVVPVSFDDSAVTLAIRPWAKVADFWNVHADTIKAVKSAFDREKISIPFPQLDVHQV